MVAINKHGHVTYNGFMAFWVQTTLLDMVRPID